MYEDVDVRILDPPLPLVDWCPAAPSATWQGSVQQTSKGIGVKGVCVVAGACLRSHWFAFWLLGTSGTCSGGENRQTFLKDECTRQFVCRIGQCLVILKAEEMPSVLDLLKP